MNNVLKLYVNSTCPLCKVLKGILEYNNVKFELINIDDSNKEVLPSGLNNNHVKNIAFPVVVLNDNIILGYNKEKLEKLLNRKLIEPPIEELLRDISQYNDKNLMKYYKTIELFSEYSGYYLNPDKNYVLMLLDSQLKNQKNGIKYCPCKLGDIICPCPDRDEEIKTYGHCFCGLYVSKEYIKNWKPQKTLSMLSNRSIKTYKSVPENINSHFLKIHIFFNKDIVRYSNNSIDIDEFLDKSYNLKNSGYGFKNNILVKFKEDEVHKNLQLWYNNFDEYYSNKLNIISDYDFDIAINTPIEVPNGKKIKFKDLCITTNYNTPQYRRRYLIEGKTSNPNILDVVDCIIILEVVKCVNSMMKNSYLEYSEKIESLQKDINNLVIEVNVSDEHSFEKYLSMLSMSVKNISNLQERITKKYNLFEYYMTKKLGSEKFKSFLQSMGYDIKYRPILKDFTHLLNELSIMKNTVNELIEILETNVNISQNNKAIKLQNEIHNTAKTQLNMHKAIEGLYTIFAAFYFTELALIIFEGLNHAKIVKYNAYILASLFIPVAILLGIIISKKLKKKHT